MYKIYRETNETRQSVRQNEPGDVIKGRDENLRSGKGKPLKRDGSIDATRLILSDTLSSLETNRKIIR